MASLRIMTQTRLVAGRAVGWASGLVALSAALTYAYELTGFHLTLDEPVLGAMSRRANIELYLAQGRWTTGVMSALLPSLVTPVVPLFVGVASTGWALWVIARHVARLPPWPASAAAGVAVSLPMTAFLYSWSSVAAAAGVAFAALAWQAVSFRRGSGMSRFSPERSQQAPMSPSSLRSVVSCSSGCGGGHDLGRPGRAPSFSSGPPSRMV